MDKQEIVKKIHELRSLVSQEGLQREFIDVLCEELFNTPQEKDIISLGKDGKMYLKGQQLTAMGANEIIRGARALKDMVIWRALLEEGKVVAGKRVYFQSKDIADIVFGKAMLYTIDILEKKIEHLAAMRLFTEPKRDIIEE